LSLECSSSGWLSTQSSRIRQLKTASCSIWPPDYEKINKLNNKFNTKWKGSIKVIRNYIQGEFLSNNIYISWLVYGCINHFRLSLEQYLHIVLAVYLFLIKFDCSKKLF
jgi:hypothetical protein